NHSIYFIKMLPRILYPENPLLLFRFVGSNLSAFHSLASVLQNPQLSGMNLRWPLFRQPCLWSERPTVHHLLKSLYPSASWMPLWTWHDGSQWLPVLQPAFCTFPVRIPVSGGRSSWPASQLLWLFRQPSSVRQPHAFE